MRQLYDRAFFDWVRLTALASARGLLPVVQGALAPASVVDVGCGEGAWLSVWAGLGVDAVTGIDGGHVDRASLMIPPGRFLATDLAKPFALPRRFDLVQSLEVAEHLPAASAEGFVDSLCGLGDVVLFSAAQPGQGGENHLNERSPSFWAALFMARGYAAFDCIRPALAGRGEVAPWYRFNTVLYANAAGQARLSKGALARRCDDPVALDRAGDLRWRLRRLVLARLPRGGVTALSRLRYRMVGAAARLTHARG